MRIKNLLSISIVLGLIFTGCSSKNTNMPNQCIINGEVAPKWICNVPAKDDNKYYAVASADNYGDRSLQEEEAVETARAFIARNISSDIKAMFKRYVGTTGTVNDKTVDKTVDSVIKNVAYGTLNNTRIEKKWYSKDGKILYVLVSVEKKDAVNNFIKNIRTSFRNNKALWQKYLSDKAFKKLEENFDKEYQ